VETGAISTASPARHSRLEYTFFDEKGPPNGGFSHRQRSLETDVRTFWAENSQKSPAESKKTPVFWRLALATFRRKIDVSGNEVSWLPQNKTRRGERRAQVGLD
jgi:hypothetical protein